MTEEELERAFQRSVGNKVEELPDTELQKLFKHSIGEGPPVETRSDSGKIGGLESLEELHRMSIGAKEPETPLQRLFNASVGVESQPLAEGEETQLQKDFAATIPKEDHSQLIKDLETIPDFKDDEGVLIERLPENPFFTDDEGSGIQIDNKFPELDETTPYIVHPQSGAGDIEGSFAPGLFDDPIGFSEDILRGIGHAPFKFAYDLGSLAHDPEEVGRDYWEAVSWLGFDPSTTSKATGSLAPFVATWQASALQLAKIPKVGQALHGTSAWKKYAALMGIEAVAEVPAALIHTRKHDGSIIEMFAPETRNDVFRWFMDREDDSELEGRFKNAIEGGIIGAGIAGTTKGLFDSAKAMKRFIHSSAEDSVEAAQMVDQFLSNGDGTMLNEQLKEGSVSGHLMPDKMEGAAFRDNVYHAPDDEVIVGLEQRARNRAKQPNSADVEAQVAKSLGDNDIDFVPTPEHQTAAAKRVAEDNYDVFDDLQGKPLEDLVNQNVNRADIQTEKRWLDFMGADLARSKEMAEQALRDPNISKADKQFYKRYLGDPEADTARLRGKTSGDVSVDSTLRVAKVILHRSQQTLGKVPKRSKDSSILDAVKKQMEGDLWKATKEATKGISNSPETMATHAARLAAIMPEMEDVLTVVRNARFEMGKSISTQAKTLSKHKTLEDFLKDPQGLKFLKELYETARLDADLGVAASSFGRGLNSFNYSPSEFGKALVADIEGRIAKSNQILKDRKSITKKMKAEGKSKAEINEAVKGLKDPLEDANVAEKMALWITKGDWDNIRDSVKILASDSSATGIANATRGPGLLNMFNNYVRGTLLSSTRTLIGSVLWGGAAQTALKQVLAPAFEGLLGDMAAIVGKRHIVGGASTVDSLIAAQSLMKETINLITSYGSAVKNGKFKARIAEGADLGFTSLREGTEGVEATATDIRAQWAKTVDYYVENDMMAKASIARLMSFGRGYAGGVSNYMGRRIKDADDAIKALNHAATIDVAAERAWRIEAAEKLYGNRLSKEEFIKRYKQNIKKVSEISNNPKLSNEQQAVAVDKLFKGNTAARDEIIMTLERAKRIAQEATLQQDPSDALTKPLVDGLVNTLGNAGTPGKVTAMLVLPFRKTPVNAVEEILAFTPAAITSKRLRERLRTVVNAEGKRVPKDSKEFYRGLSQIMAGSSILLWGAHSMLEGRITGAFPPDEIKATTSAKVPPFSIRIGDTWYDYRKLGPIAALLASIASFGEAEHLANEENINIISAKIYGQAIALTASEGHIRTMEELAKVMQSDNIGEGIGELLIDRSAKAILPAQGLSKDILDYFDDTKNIHPADEEVAGLMDWMKDTVLNAYKDQGLPNLVDKTFNTKLFVNDINMVGETRQKYGSGTTNKILHFMGFGNMDADVHKTIEEYHSFGLIPKGTTAPVHGGIPLTKEQERLYYTNVWSDEFKQRIENYINSPAYDKLFDHQKISFLKTSLEEQKKMVKSIIEATDPELQYKMSVKRLYDHYKDIQQAGAERPEGELKYMYKSQKKSERKRSTKHKVREKFLEQLGVDNE